VSNSWFQFKQFRIDQDKTAMKVGTDGVLLGASVDVSNAVSALDIGTGTGLVALMMVQRNNNLHADAIDIDANACEQARGNFSASPWPGRLKVFHSSLQEFFLHEKTYDLIVCNPPFFINSKRPSHAGRRIARHSDMLPLSDLFQYSSRMLTHNGKMTVVFPYSDKNMLLTEAAGYGLYPSHILYVRHNRESEFVRIVVTFVTEVSGITERELDIETGKRHEYTEEFKKMVRDFYLYVD